MTGDAVHLALDRSGNGRGDYSSGVFSSSRPVLGIDLQKRTVPVMRKTSHAPKLFGGFHFLQVNLRHRPRRRNKSWKR